MRIAMVSGLAALALAVMALGAVADVGPRRPDPSREACNGLQAGAACVFRGQAGTCQGPHVSRLYCRPGAPPPSDGSAGSDSSGSAAPSATPATPPTPAPSPAPVPSPAPAPSADPATPPAPATASPTPAAGSAQDPAAEPTTSPGHKRGCAVADPGSLAPVGLALAALALRRRRSRSMS